MKVLLQKTVKELGQAGAIVDVADAYARNFLLPQKLAVVATPAVQSAEKARQLQAQKKKERDQVVMTAAKERLMGVTVHLSGRGPAGGHLYQALHEADIVQAIAVQYGLSLADIRLEPAIFKAAGRHSVTLYWPDRTTTPIVVEVEVVAE